MSASAPARRRPHRVAARRWTIFVAASAVIASAAHGDRLVTRDGSSLETRGAWVVEGTMVRFTDRAGVLRTLRLGEVDLEASRAATAAGQPAPADPEPGAAAGAPAAATLNSTAGTAAATPPSGAPPRAPTPRAPTAANPLALGTSGDASRSPLAAAANAAHHERGAARPSVAVLRDGDVATVDAAELAAARAQSQPIVLYGTTWCGWCKKVRQLLTQLGANWVERDIEHTPGARQELARITGSSAVPVVVHGSLVVRGFKAGAIERLVLAGRPPVGDPPPADPSP